MPFHHFITIDYSARNKPSPVKPSSDAIWVAEAKVSGPVTTTYFRTRHACQEHIEQRLLSLRDRRVFVGWDFSFGYPRGTAKALRLKTKPAWRAIWELLAELVDDRPDNSSNRFLVGARLNELMRAPAGPFWGGGRGESGLFLGAKKDFDYPVPTPKVLLPERRRVEVLYKRMQPAWKLAYIGSVGSQSLLGIPRLLALRDHEKLGAISRVWPFEQFDLGGDAGAKTSGSDPGGLIVHAEIYPSLLTLTGSDDIKDREQVRTYVQWLQTRQAEGELSALLDRPWGYDEKLHRRVTDHEGWVLGL